MAWRLGFMASKPFSSALVLGINGHVGGYLARLLHARGVGVLAAIDPDHPGPDAIAALGIADDITLVAPGDVTALAGNGDIGAIFAIAGTSDAQAARIAEAVAAAESRSATRLCHVVDSDALRTNPASLANARRIADLRRDADRHAANAILHAHDSRLGPDDNLAALITGTAFRIAQGEILPRLVLEETGPRDWGWTPEYVDAVQRLAALPRPIDMAIASGHGLTVAEFAEHAFRFFGLDPADHVTITGSAAASDTDAATAAAAIKAATGWSASTWGRDLVRALCEGAAGRAMPDQR